MSQEKKPEGVAGMEGVESLAEKLRQANPETPVEVIRGASYRDSRTVIVCPTRGLVHHQVMASFIALQRPMNTGIGWLLNAGDEISKAYNNLFRTVINDPAVSSFPFILTLEDDMLIPSDAHLRLLHAMHEHPEYAAISGLYYQKAKGGMPLVLGDPANFDGVSRSDFQPRPPEPGKLLEVNAIPMGCALWRVEPFRKMEYPYFVPDGLGQDLEVCRRLKVEQGARFAVDCDLRVGHLDVRTGVVW